MTKLKTMKIRSQLFLLVLTAGFFCFLLYHFLWMYKWQVYDLLHATPLQKVLPYPDDDFWLTLRQEALKYSVPESEDDSAGVKAFEPFFDFADEYTGISVYGQEDGLFRAGKYPPIYTSDNRVLFDILYKWADVHGEHTYDISAEFQNGYAQVMVTLLHPTLFVAPYFFSCFGFCVILFFLILVIFINRKMRSVILLKQTILQMASRDLESSVPELYQDEIGILAHELDNLRAALSETITQEQANRKANQDLIFALSHDLRTPLTILNGYLEVAKLNQTLEKQAEYLNRCLNKSDEIKEITDRIFEYAYLYEETETPELRPVSIRLLFRHLEENADFLRLMGFTVNITLPEEASSSIQPQKDVPMNSGREEDSALDSVSSFPDCSGRQNQLYFDGEETLLKRIFNNLFSNIIKYGSKKEPVTITGSIRYGKISILLENSVKENLSNIESTQIGLKSVGKMLLLMDGTLEAKTRCETFIAILEIPLFAHIPS